MAELMDEASTRLPTRFGNMLVKVYRTGLGSEPMAIISGSPQSEPIVPVRVHSACMTSEVLGSMKCDCKTQLDWALQYIADAQNGVVIYLPQEGRGVGLVNKIRAYSLQEQGLDTLDANRALGLPDDARSYEDAASILDDLGIRRIRLLTNNPKKVNALKTLGIDVCERVPLPVMPNVHSLHYLKTKRARMGHLLEIGGEPPTDAQVSEMRRPVVHVNFALDCNGRTALDTGQSLQLSCATDWRRVHELREHYSAVVVGARTWQLDSPRLTARREHLGREPRRQPERVIFAGRKTVEVVPDGRRTFVVGANRRYAGGIGIEAQDHGVVAPLEVLHRYGIRSILVEGGLTLLRSFIRDGQVDCLTIYVRSDSKDRVVGAVDAALAGVPVPVLQYERFGEGTLVSGINCQDFLSQPN
ncbi:MAG: GTP cyclohydrolase II [Chromatiaceae bacterium]|nr:GTP cyclohydrolase II [Chromatiaceae bacterium]